METLQANDVQGAILRPHTLPYPQQTEQSPAGYAAALLRFSVLWLSFAGWLAFFVVPFFTGVHGVGIHHPAANLPFALMGFTLWTAMDAAHQLRSNGRFCLFLFTLALLAGWY